MYIDTCLLKYKYLFLGQELYIYKTICEGDIPAEIKCPLNKKIKLINVFYGRDYKDVCTADSIKQQQNINCNLENAIDYYKS